MIVGKGDHFQTTQHLMPHCKHSVDSGSLGKPLTPCISLFLGTDSERGLLPAMHVWSGSRVGGAMFSHTHPTF